MRSVLAVLAGYITAVVLVFAFFGIHRALVGADFVPGTGFSLLSLAWGVLTAVAAGWVTARLAPARPLAHAAALIALSLTIGIVFTWIVPTTDAAAAQPLWIQIGNLVVVVIGVPIGAHLARR